MRIDFNKFSFVTMYPTIKLLPYHFFPYTNNKPCAFFVNFCAISLIGNNLLLIES